MTDNAIMIQALTREAERIEEDSIHSAKGHFNAGDTMRSRLEARLQNLLLTLQAWLRGGFEFQYCLRPDVGRHSFFTASSLLRGFAGSRHR